MNARLIAVTLLLAAPSVAAAGGPPPATLPPDAATVATLRAWFAGYEHVPTEADFKRLGDRLAPALVRLAVDDDEDLLVRARAVSAMLNAPGEPTRLANLALLAAPATPSLLRRKAVQVLAAHTGARHQAEILRVYLQAGADLPLREACARAFRRMGPAAYDLRARLLKTETAPIVKALLQLDESPRELNVQPRSKP